MNAARKRWIYIAIAWLAAALISLPVILRWNAPPPSAFRTHLIIDLSYVAAAVLCYAFYRHERRAMSRSQAIALVFLIFVSSSIVNEVHRFEVDNASNYVPPNSNELFQERLQEQVVRLSPGAIPHSYRFLPNAAVYWLQMAGARFDVARDVYRLLVGLLLFYSLYRFARLYTNLLGGIVTILLAAMIYPISFENYVGQLTDPLSHLSFLLGFIFLETESFGYLLTTVLLGSLAKESILALCGLYALSYRKRSGGARKAAVLIGASAAIFIAVRLFVLHAGIEFAGVSGTGPAHVIENWNDTKWRRLFALTGGAYLPLLALGWKTTPRSLKALILYLIPVLFVSSLFFSWLSESRNWMPAVFPLAVSAALYWTGSDNATKADAPLRG